jgi:flavin reductase (DIM6/NTAB) family NADH-FMN oxidoreductase RutF
VNDKKTRSVGNRDLEIIIDDTDDDQFYKLLTSSVVPRPIAWISTLSTKGTVNLAPFSAFTFVSSKPPMLAVSIGRRDGRLKDTTANILATKEFVVNIANFALAKAVQTSSEEFSAEISEVDQINIQTSPSRMVDPPRIALAPISLECRLHQCIELGREHTALIIGSVVCASIQDGLMQNGKINTRELDPLVRVAGPNYARIGEIISAY